jgi:hypothetical protein
MLQDNAMTCAFMGAAMSYGRFGDRIPIRRGREKRLILPLRLLVNQEG